MSFRNSPTTTDSSSPTSSSSSSSAYMPWWQRIVLDEAFRHSVMMMSTRLVRGIEESCETTSSGEASEHAHDSNTSNAASSASAAQNSKRKVKGSLVPSLFPKEVVLERPIPHSAVSDAVIKEAFTAYHEYQQKKKPSTSNNAKGGGRGNKRGERQGAGEAFVTASGSLLRITPASQGNPMLAQPMITLETRIRMPSNSLLEDFHSSSSHHHHHQRAESGRTSFKTLITCVPRFTHVPLWRPHALPTYHVPLTSNNTAAVSANGRVAMSGPLTESLASHHNRRRLREQSAHGRANKFFRRLINEQRLAAGRRVSTNSDSEADGDYGVARPSYGLIVAGDRTLKMPAVSESLFSPSMAVQSHRTASEGFGGSGGSQIAFHANGDGHSHRSHVALAGNSANTNAFAKLKEKRERRRTIEKLQRRMEGLPEAGGGGSGDSDDENNSVTQHRHSPLAITTTISGERGETSSAFTTDDTSLVSPSSPTSPAALVDAYAGPLPIAEVFPPSGFVVEHASRADIYMPPYSANMLRVMDEGSARIVLNSVNTANNASSSSSGGGGGEGDGSGGAKPLKDNPPLPPLATAAHVFSGASSECDWHYTAAVSSQKEALFTAMHSYLKERSEGYISSGGGGGGVGGAASSAAAHRTKPSAFTDIALSQAVAMVTAAHNASSAASSRPTSPPPPPPPSQPQMALALNPNACSSQQLAPPPTSMSAVSLAIGATGVPLTILHRRWEEVEDAIRRTFHPHNKSLLDYTRPPPNGPPPSSAAAASTRGRAIGCSGSSAVGSTTTTASPILGGKFHFAQRVYEQPIAVVAIRKTPREVMREECGSADTNNTTTSSFRTAKEEEEALIAAAMASNPLLLMSANNSSVAGGGAASMEEELLLSSPSAIAAARYASLDVPFTVAYAQVPLPRRYLGAVRPAMRLVRWHVLTEAIHRCYQEEQWRLTSAASLFSSNAEDEAGGNNLKTLPASTATTVPFHPNSHLGALRGADRLKFYEQFIHKIPDIESLLLEQSNDAAHRSQHGLFYGGVMGRGGKGHHSGHHSSGENSHHHQQQRGFVVTKPSTLPPKRGRDAQRSPTASIKSGGMGRPNTAASCIDSHLLPPTACGLPTASFLGLDRKDLTVARHDALYRSQACRQSLQGLFDTIEKDSRDGHITKKGFVVFVLDLLHLFMPCMRREVNIATAEDEWAVFNKRWSSNALPAQPSGSGGGGASSSPSSALSVSLSPRTAYDVAPLPVSLSTMERALTQREEAAAAGLNGKNFLTPTPADTNATNPFSAVASPNAAPTLVKMINAEDGSTRHVVQYRDERRDRERALENLTLWMASRASSEFEGGGGNGAASSSDGGSGSSSRRAPLHDHESLFHCGNLSMMGHTVMYLPPTVGIGGRGMMVGDDGSGASKKSKSHHLHNVGAIAEANRSGNSGDFQHFFNFFFSFPLMLCQGEVVTEKLYVSVWSFIQDCLGMGLGASSSSTTVKLTVAQKDEEENEKETKATNTDAHEDEGRSEKLPPRRKVTSANRTVTFATENTSAAGGDKATIDGDVHREHPLLSAPPAVNLPTPPLMTSSDAQQPRPIILKNTDRYDEYLINKELRQAMGGADESRRAFLVKRIADTLARRQTQTHRIAMGSEEVAGMMAVSSKVNQQRAASSSSSSSSLGTEMKQSREAVKKTRRPSILDKLDRHNYDKNARGQSTSSSSSSSSNASSGRSSHSSSSSSSSDTAENDANAATGTRVRRRVLGGAIDFGALYKHVLCTLEGGGGGKGKIAKVEIGTRDESLNNTPLAMAAGSDETDPSSWTHPHPKKMAMMTVEDAVRAAKQRLRKVIPRLLAKKRKEEEEEDATGGGAWPPSVKSSEAVPSPSLNPVALTSYSAYSTYATPALQYKLLLEAYAREAEALAAAKRRRRDSSPMNNLQLTGGEFDAAATTPTLATEHSVALGDVGASPASFFVAAVSKVKSRRRLLKAAAIARNDCDAARLLLAFDHDAVFHHPALPPDPAVDPLLDYCSDLSDGGETTPTDGATDANKDEDVKSGIASGRKSSFRARASVNVRGDDNGLRTNSMRQRRQRRSSVVSTTIANSQQAAANNRMAAANKEREPQQQQRAGGLTPQRGVTVADLLRGEGEDGSHNSSKDGEGDVNALSVNSDAYHPDANNPSVCKKKDVADEVSRDDYDEMREGELLIMDRFASLEEAKRGMMRTAYEARLKRAEAAATAADGVKKKMDKASLGKIDDATCNPPTKRPVSGIGGGGEDDDETLEALYARHMAIMAMEEAAAKAHTDDGDDDHELKQNNEPTTTQKSSATVAIKNAQKDAAKKVAKSPVKAEAITIATLKHALTALSNDQHLQTVAVGGERASSGRKGVVDDGDDDDSHWRFDTPLLDPSSQHHQPKPYDPRDKVKEVVAARRFAAIAGGVGGERRREVKGDEGVTEANKVQATHEEQSLEPLITATTGGQATAEGVPLPSSNASHHHHHHAKRPVVAISEEKRNMIKLEAVLRLQKVSAAPSVTTTTTPRGNRRPASSSVALDGLRVPKYDLFAATTITREQSGELYGALRQQADWATAGLLEEKGSDCFATTALQLQGGGHSFPPPPSPQRPSTAASLSSSLPSKRPASSGGHKAWFSMSARQSNTRTHMTTRSDSRPTTPRNQQQQGAAVPTPDATPIAHSHDIDGADDDAPGALATVTKGEEGEPNKDTANAATKSLIALAKQSFSTLSQKNRPASATSSAATSLSHTMAMEKRDGGGKGFASANIHQPMASEVSDTKTLKAFKHGLAVKKVADTGMLSSAAAAVAGPTRRQESVAGEVTANASSTRMSSTPMAFSSLKGHNKHEAEPSSSSAASAVGPINRLGKPGCLLQGTALSASTHVNRLVNHNSSCSNMAMRGTHGDATQSGEMMMDHSLTAALDKDSNTYKVQTPSNIAADKGMASLRAAAANLVATATYNRAATVMREREEQHTLGDGTFGNATPYMNEGAGRCDGDDTVGRATRILQMKAAEEDAVARKRGGGGGVAAEATPVSRDEVYNPLLFVDDRRAEGEEDADAMLMSGTFARSTIAKTQLVGSETVERQRRVDEDRMLTSLVEQGMPIIGTVHIGGGLGMGIGGDAALTPSSLSGVGPHHPPTAPTPHGRAPYILSPQSVQLMKSRGVPIPPSAPSSRGGLAHAATMTASMQRANTTTAITKGLDTSAPATSLSSSYVRPDSAARAAPLLIDQQPSLRLTTMCSRGGEGDAQMSDPIMLMPHVPAPPDVETVSTSDLLSYYIGHPLYSADPETRAQLERLKGLVRRQEVLERGRGPAPGVLSPSFLLHTNDCAYDAAAAGNADASSCPAAALKVQCGQRQQGWFHGARGNGSAEEKKSAQTPTDSSQILPFAQRVPSAPSRPLLSGVGGSVGRPPYDPSSVKLKLSCGSVGDVQPLSGMSLPPSSPSPSAVVAQPPPKPRPPPAPNRTSAAASSVVISARPAITQYGDRIVVSPSPRPSSALVKVILQHNKDRLAEQRLKSVLPSGSVQDTVGLTAVLKTSPRR